jgi:serine/threonine protein kinase
VFGFSVSRVFCSDLPLEAGRVLERARLTDLVEAVADGRPLDWAATESDADSDAERSLVAELHAIAEIGRLFASLSSIGPESVIRSPDPEPPATWGVLQIRDRVGSGRFGVVYRAWNPTLHRDVALKLLRGREGRRPDDDEHVIEEGRMMARIRHPNVVTVYGAQRLDGQTGLVLEFVRGRTLEADLRERGPFNADELTHVGIEICRALAAVHDAGLVHRDVKAQNVLRENSGRILLGDFGTGRELDECSGRKELAGTPAYLAPEIFEHAPATARSDLYSLGALLFHLATGTYPVTGGSLEEIRRTHAEGRRTSIRVLRPDPP